MWNAVNSLVSILNIQYNSLVNSATNWGPQSNTMLSGSLCNFHMLSLNNLARPSADMSGPQEVDLVSFHFFLFFSPIYFPILLCSIFSL